jgi:hypothetical protein
MFDISLIESPVSLKFKGAICFSQLSGRVPMQLIKRNLLGKGDGAEKDV